MRDVSSVTEGGWSPLRKTYHGYVLTEWGRAALRDSITCDCHPKFVGLLFTCNDCGTIYGRWQEQLPQRAQR